MAPGYGHGSHTRPHSKIQDKTLLGWRSLRDERKYVSPNSQSIGESLNLNRLKQLNESNSIPYALQKKKN